MTCCWASSFLVMSLAYCASFKAGPPPRSFGWVLFLADLMWVKVVNILVLSGGGRIWDIITTVTFGSSRSFGWVLLLADLMWVEDLGALLAMVRWRCPALCWPECGEVWPCLWFVEAMRVNCWLVSIRSIFLVMCQAWWELGLRHKCSFFI